MQKRHLPTNFLLKNCPNQFVQNLTFKGEWLAPALTEIFCYSTKPLKRLFSSSSQRRLCIGVSRRQTPLQLVVPSQVLILEQVCLLRCQSVENSFTWERDVEARPKCCCSDDEVVKRFKGRVGKGGFVVRAGTTTQDLDPSVGWPLVLSAWVRVCGRTSHT